jgi:glycogen(starch) synthase
LRLGILTTEYPPFTPEKGGIGTLFGALTPKLVELGQDVHVFALSHDGEAVEDHRGVRLHHLRPPSRTIDSFVEGPTWSLLAARALRREGRFDLVWAPEWSGSGWAYSRRRDAGPLVTHLFTSIAQVAQLSGGWSKRLEFQVQNSLERRQTERSDALIAQTQAILDWARLDVTTTRALGEGPLPGDLPEGRPRIVFFGRLEPRKGVDVLLEGMPLVWKQFPEASLVILGDGDDYFTQKLRDLAGGKVDHVHLLGHRSSDALFPVVRTADVVALPSRWENFALSALETMALGRPLVLTEAGGASEFCNDGVDALLVPPNDSAMLGSAIRRLLESTDLREGLGSEAVKTADRYDVSAVAPQYLSYFEALSG